MTVLAARKWATNADLIVDAAELGYLRSEWVTLDPTYGKGTFWKKWQPDELVACDLDPLKCPMPWLSGIDFTDLPFVDAQFDAVVFDPPYKLNGTATDEVDERYGVHVKASWQQRHELIRAGIDECARVLKRSGWFLLKCQDQVCSGAIRWQTDDFTSHAKGHGLVKVDRFDMLGGRPQPAFDMRCTHKPRHRKADCPELVQVPRRQVHAQMRPSTLLVFQKGKP